MRLRSLPPALDSTLDSALDSVLVAVVAAVVYAVHGFEGTLVRDLGVFTYGGQRVADGVLPYVGIFNTVGPLADAVPGAAIRVGELIGVGPVSAERHLFWVLSVGCCVLVAALGRRVGGSRVVGLLAAALFLTFEDFTHLATNGPREKTVMVLFLLAAMLLLERRRWTAAGACTALATLTWQPALLVAVTAAVTTLLRTPRGEVGRLRAVAGYVLGGAVPTALVVAVYAVQGELHRGLLGFLLVNARYTRQTSVYSAPHFVADVLWEGYGWSLVLVLAGLVAAVGAAVVALIRGPRDARVTLGAAALVGVVWTTTAVNGAPDLFVVLPFAAVGAALALHALLAALAALARRPGWAAPVLAGLTAGVVVLAGVQSAATRQVGLRAQERDVDAVLAAVPDADLMAIDAPQVLALAGRVSPTPFQIFDVGIDGYLEATWPGGLQGFAAWIAARRPTLIVRALDDHQTWPDAMLARHYVLAGCGPQWRWYVSRAAGPAVLDAVREANRQARWGTRRAGAPVG
ncbi:hypothetical protein GCM10022215_43890 [Nocardioides fonticola]|uniref:Glycosyltransferase RgtA/B/C/D-like domain-containing protein n=1 Tax=Nocardioides fonticola TaxID=450363 RepID=A0ABP7Y6K1_9ACTN